jgi:hypothetical protein
MPSISSSLTARFSARTEPPASALARWRKTPPDWLPSRYVEVDDSYNSVTWEWRQQQAMMRLVTLNGLLGGVTCYRLTALFEDDGSGGSRITLDGQADRATRAAIVAAADSVFEGGLV